MTPAEEPVDKPREIRVFISSTFRDMHKEREELVKRVFPKLRKMCEERGVVWGEVDLRWGINDEQKAEGKVLPICLKEIDRCRPYFIGILGERYGWVPDAIPEDLIEREPWLSDHRSSSVTELEILHGTLNNPEMAEYAFFYFRDPAYVSENPMEYRESATPEEVEQYGEDKVKQRAQCRREKLAALKDQIRSKFPVHEDCSSIHENYPNPKAFGEQVLEDLTQVINAQFPLRQVPDALERERFAHETFAASRYFTRNEGIYICRQAYFDRLNAHAKGEGPPLVILGESGAGKSALLTHWVKRYREELKTQPQKGEMGSLHPTPSRADLNLQLSQKTHVIVHFIGATKESTNWAAMLRRLIGEFNRLFGLEIGIPDEPDALRQAFAEALWQVDIRGRVILIIDALNQLDDRDGALDLVWLPPEIPKNIRLIVSTLSGRCLDNLKERNWFTFTIEPLTIDERQNLIINYLHQYSKVLSSDLVQKIAAADSAKNPLYLIALLEEMRLYGDHDSLLQKVDSYLEAKTVPELFSKILERYEEDYEDDRPDLVRDAFSYIWASRKGLSETELLELLGSRGSPLPRAYWSPLSLAAEHNLINRSGYLGFYHDYFREAIRERYLNSETAQVKAHLAFAEYFETCESHPRLCEEFPWQLAQGKAWEHLVSQLTQPDFFMTLWDANQYDVQEYWVQIEAGSSYTMANTYQPVLDAPEEYDDSYLFRLSSLLAGAGNLNEASLLRTYLIGYYREIGDQENLERSLGNHANVLYSRGDLDEAMKLRKERERICRKIGAKEGLSAALGSQAVILADRGDLDGAMKLHREEEQICRELGAKEYLQASLANQAGILKVRGDLDEAMELLKEQEQICRKHGLKDSLQLSLGNQALILKVRGDLDGAMTLFGEQEQICRKLGLKDSLQVSLGNQAGVLKVWGDLNGAMEFLKEQERICRTMGQKDGLSVSLGNQALILNVAGDPARAMVLLREQELICREIGAKACLQASLGNQANILAARGNLDEAMELLKKVERTCREIGMKEFLQASLESQANILVIRRDLDGAMVLLEEQEQICRELGLKDGLQRSFRNQALILIALGDLDGAMELLKKQEQICRELGARDSLVYSLMNQATVHDKRGEPQKARRLMEEAYQIAMTNGYHALVNQIEKAFLVWTVDPLAQAIHAEYVTHVAPGSGGHPPPMAVPWDTLPEEFREANRDQAREILQKLQALNYRVLPKTMGADGAVTAFTESQIELLARMEHDRWVEEKQRNGWIVGTPRDNEKKVHPDLIPWDDLDEIAKEKDRNAVRVIPKILEGAGLGIYPVL